MPYSPLCRSWPSHGAFVNLIWPADAGSPGCTSHPRVLSPGEPGGPALPGGGPDAGSRTRYRRVVRDHRSRPANGSKRMRCYESGHCPSRAKRFIIDIREQFHRLGVHSLGSTHQRPSHAANCPAVDVPLEPTQCPCFARTVHLKALRHFGRYRGMQGEQHYAGEEFEASDTDAKAWAGRGFVRILSRIT
jgi:hypothetical protein